MRAPPCIYGDTATMGEEFNRPYGTDTHGAIMAKVRCPYGTDFPSHEDRRITYEQRSRPLLAGVSRPSCPHPEMHPPDCALLTEQPAWR